MNSNSIFINLKKQVLFMINGRKNFRALRQQLNTINHEYKMQNRVKII